MSRNIESSLRSYIVSRLCSVRREREGGEGEWRGQIEIERERGGGEKKRSAEQQLVPHL